MKGQIKTISLKDCVPGPIQHAELPDWFLELSRRVYYWVGRHVSKSLGQWETGFMRDMHPVRELVIWTTVGLAMDRYFAGRRSLLTPKHRAKVIGNLLAYCSGVAKPRPDRKFAELYEAVRAELDGKSFEDILAMVPGAPPKDGEWVPLR